MDIGSVAIVFRVAVSFLVPALVWAMLILGSYQLIRDKARQLRSWRRSYHRLAHTRRTT
jgi:hypothetical protein